MPSRKPAQTNGESLKNVACTFCGSTNTELMGLFGPFHLASQYYCLDCHSPFARIKWQSEHPQKTDEPDEKA